MNKQVKNPSEKFSVVLWSAAGILGLCLLFSWSMFPELFWLFSFFGLALFGVLIALIGHYSKTRQGQQGVYNILSALLVFIAVMLLNFIVARYPQKLDLTKNKAHTFSDQTMKVMNNLKQPVKAALFTKAAQREEFRPLLENYKSLNTRFEVEYVDPDKEPARARQLNIRKYGTLHLVVGNRDQKIEEPTEEKVTNALIKLLKDDPQFLCVITGHGEKSPESAETDGFENVRKGLLAQAYSVEAINIVQKKGIPGYCTAITIFGPTRAFFPQEVQLVKEFLDNGGRAIIALDLALNAPSGSPESAPELLALLEKWYVKPQTSLIVDPLSKMLGVDASVPIVATYSKDHVITKDFQNNSYFPFPRPLDILPNVPAELKVTWLAQTTPKSWAERDLANMGKGQVQFDEGADKAGPLNIAVAVSGKMKESKSKRETRLVVFGTSFFANNNYTRFGGNYDLFLNAASWVLEDEE